jgi:hypothetical protein
MSASGQNFNQTVTLDASPEEISQAIVSGTAGTPDYTITTAGPGTIVMTRRYRPTWTIVVAIVGALFFLIGLLALLYTATETLTITLVPMEDGTKVTVSGVASQELLARLTASLNSIPAIASSNEFASAGRQVAAQIATPSSPEGPSDTKVCPQCAEQVKAAAKVCRYCSTSFEDALSG